MKNKVSYSDVKKAIRAIQDYCWQHETCEKCPIYNFCLDNWKMDCGEPALWI